MKYDVIIFDGNNTAHKAYNVNKHLSVFVDCENKNVGMMFGFLNILKNIYNNFCKSNSKIICVWDAVDSGECNKSIDAYYKGNRRLNTFDGMIEKQLIHNLMIETKFVLSKLNILQLEKHKKEADDLIATIAKRYESKNKRVLIVSEDKDLRQVISDNINMYGINSKRIWNNEYYTEMTKLKRPSFFADYLSIVGDSSDGYGGVLGFGEARAIKLLNYYSDIEDEHLVPLILDDISIIDKYPEWDEKLKNSFKENLSDLDKCYKLALLDLYIDRATIIHNTKEYDIGSFVDICKKYKFNSILSNKDVFQDIFYMRFDGKTKWL